MSLLTGMTPRLTMYMLIGIAGMFLAPFGMLISKWAAMKAFIDSRNILTLIILCYGSAATLFYWTKWMGKLVANANRKDSAKHIFHKHEEISIVIHAVLVLLACFTLPFISSYAIVPYVSGLFGSQAQMPIDNNNINIMLIMLAMLIVLPLSFKSIIKNEKRRVVPVYMSGVNTGDNESIHNAFGTNMLESSNWYLEKYFGSKRLTFWGNWIIIAVICAGIILLVGGAK